MATDTQDMGEMLTLVYDKPDGFDIEDYKKQVSGKIENYKDLLKGYVIFESLEGPNQVGLTLQFKDSKTPKEKKDEAKDVLKIKNLGTEKASYVNAIKVEEKFT